MHSKLNNLDRGVIAGLDGGVCRERHLRKADGARVRVLAWAEDLEDGDHGEGHVEGTAVGPVAAEAHVGIHHCLGVALEPAWLEGKGTTRRGPVGPVLGNVHAAAFRDRLVRPESLTYIVNEV